jgi:hypothetical protein
VHGAYAPPKLVDMHHPEQITKAESSIFHVIKVCELFPWAGCNMLRGGVQDDAKEYQNNRTQ